MSNEWYTPSKYIEAARQVMGSIDLDPASCELANQTVRATRYYTQEDDGLSKAWYGNVWCNPPYSRTPDCQAPQPTWLHKLKKEHKVGNINQAILLIMAVPKQKWFQYVWEYTVCFPSHRIYFARPGEHPETPRFGTCFVYLGANEARFIDVFSQFGRIAKAVDVPVAKPRQLELVS